MKHLITYPRHLTRHQNRPGPQSRFNTLIDLAPMMKIIEILMRRIQGQMHVVDMTEMYRLFARKARQEKELERAKTHNFKTHLKWNMLRRPDWRKKVLETLGGEDALSKWERRAAKVKARSPKPYKARPYKRPPLATLRLGGIQLPPLRTPFDVKTDETGCFRLAPIPAAKAKRPESFEPEALTETQKWERKEGWRLRVELREKQYPYEPVDENTLKGYWYKDENKNTIYRLTPIPVLPDELRGYVPDDVIPDEAEPMIRDPGSLDEGKIKLLSAPKVQTSTSALQGGDPGSAGIALVRDDNGSDSSENDNTHVIGPD